MKKPKRKITARERTCQGCGRVFSTADDTKRSELAGCRADLAVESEVADACMAVVEQCRALVESNACACWRVE